MISRGWFPVARVLTWLYRSYALSRYRPNAWPMSTWTSPYFLLSRLRTVFTAKVARLPPRLLCAGRRCLLHQAHISVIAHASTSTYRHFTIHFHGLQPKNIYFVFHSRAAGFCAICKNGSCFLPCRMLLYTYAGLQKKQDKSAIASKEAATALHPRIQLLGRRPLSGAAHAV